MILKRIYIVLLLLVASVASWAQVAPKWAKKMQKSIVSVLTYGEDGTLLKSGTGFYVDKNTVVADYSLFRGSYNASVIDQKGNKSTVTAIVGADDTYGVVRFRTDAKKAVPLIKAAVPSQKGETLWVLYFSKETYDWWFGGGYRSSLDFHALFVDLSILSHQILESHPKNTSGDFFF